MCMGNKRNGESYSAGYRIDHRVQYLVHLLFYSTNKFKDFRKFMMRKYILNEENFTST